MLMPHSKGMNKRIHLKYFQNAFDTEHLKLVLTVDSSYPFL